MAPLSVAPSGLRKASRVGAWFTMLFGLPFFVIGVFFSLAALNGQMADDSGEPFQQIFGVVFGLVFALVGLGVMSSGFFAIKKQRKVEALIARHPDEPWRVDKRWAMGGDLKDGGLGAVIGLAIFAVFWNAISWTIFSMLYFVERERDLFPLIFIGIFLLIGLAIIAAFIYKLAQFIRYGTSVLKLTEMPGRVGGVLGGVILTKARVPANREGFKLRLRCLHIYYTGSGKNRSRHEDTLWEAEEQVEPDSRDAQYGRSAIPVFFEIPDCCEATSFPGALRTINWKLSASAAVPGVDYKADFEVPVYADPERG
ncbi:MAG: hypothetical protein ACOCVG_00840 [Verrucomicrobiota bacterium]